MEIEGDSTHAINGFSSDNRNEAVNSDLNNVGKDVSSRKRYERRVRDLEAFGHRGSTSKEEAHAAKYLSKELSAMGLEPSLESFKGASSLGLVLFLPVLLAGIGAGFLWYMPEVTLFLGIISLASFLADSTSRCVSLGKIIRTRLSQNVSATIRVKTGKPRLRLVVLGHYDTQRTGILWNDKLLNIVSPLMNRSPGITKSPVFPVTLAMGLQVLAGVMALIGGHSGLISALGFITLLIYGISGLLLLQWAFGPFVPGANDNASGTAAVLSLAEFWQECPVDDVEVVCLLTGCEETGLTGAAAWAATHRTQGREIPTLFLNLDGLGYGSPRFLSCEHTLAAIPVRYPAKRVEIAQAVAIDQNLAYTIPWQSPVPTDGLAFLMRGIDGMTIISSQADGNIIPNYHQLTDRSDRMDFEVAWQAVNFAKEILRRMSA